MTARWWGRINRVDTRERILIAAERLFAEHGVEHVSLREVGERAGQRNNSAVQYHFGDKKGLIQALYDLRLVPLNEARTRMLAAVTEPTSADLVRIYVSPLADAVIAERGQWAYVRFLDRYLGRGRDVEPFDDQHNRSSQRVMRLMTDRMVDLTDELREERRRMIQVLVLRTLADLEYRFEHGLVGDASAQLTVRSLMEAVQVLIEAPSSVTN